jgi:hypothetical protein
MTTDLTNCKVCDTDYRQAFQRRHSFSIVCQDIMVWKPEKPQSHRIEDKITGNAGNALPG